MIQILKIQTEKINFLCRKTKQGLLVQMRSNVNLVLRLCQKLRSIILIYVYRITYIYIYIYIDIDIYVMEKQDIEFSHRECSHHSLYDGVGGLHRASIPVGVQRLCQLIAFGLVFLGARTGSSPHGCRHRFDPLEGNVKGTLLAC